jgi:hypothetical protein
MLTRFHTTFEPEIGTDEEVFICGKDLPGNLEGYSTRPIFNGRSNSTAQP